MKKNDLLRLILILPIFLLLVPSNGHAQRYRTDYDSLKAIINSQPDSMRHGFFHAGKFNSTFHVQFDGDITYLFQQPAALTGFQVAWVINHKLSIGAKFDILTTQVKINKYINSYDSLNTGTPNAVAIPVHPLSLSGMLNIGYIFRSDKKISIEPDLGLGWTRLSFTDPKVGWIDPTETKFVDFQQSYFIINPSLSMVWNATKYFRLGATAGVQGVFGDNYLRLKTYRIRGLYAGLFLRFGTF